MPLTGEELAAQRASLGWSQDDLAERAGVDVRSVKYWEAKRGDPIPRKRFAQLQRIINDAFREQQSRDRAGILLVEATLTELVDELNLRVHGGNGAH